MKRAIPSLVLAGLVALLFVMVAETHTAVEAAPPGAARNLRVSDVSATQASFHWRPAGGGAQQWVDISHWNGFYWQWQNAGPLNGRDRDYTWSGLLPNTTYYVRINTGYWNGVWVGSDWVKFDTRGAIQCYGSQYQQPGVYVAPGILPCNPQGPAVRIWTDRGDGSTYYIGQPVRICYSVSMPMYVQIVDIMANGAQQTLLQGYDDGRGDCLPATITPPQGLERINIYGNGTSASTYFYVR